MLCVCAVIVLDLLFNLQSPNLTIFIYRYLQSSDGGAHSGAGHSSHHYQRSASNMSAQRGETVSTGGLSSGSGGQGHGAGSNSVGGTSNPQECPLCYSTDTAQGFYVMLNCKHIACRSCLESYLTIEIFESRTEIACPECTEAMHPSDIQTLLRNFPTIMKKYEDFMVRRVLLCDPDSRWCPAPDCRQVSLIWF